MPKAFWNNKLLIGVPRLDHEHRVFAELIFCLSDEGETTGDRDAILGLMRELELYAQFHFCSEENIMRKTAYPGMQSHRHEHQMLLGRLKTNIWEYQSGNQTLQEFTSFLFEWFAFHTANVDMELAGFLREEHPEILAQQAVLKETSSE